MNHKRTLALDDAEKANAWFAAFTARCRREKLVDDTAEKGVEGRLQTDLFVELCGESAYITLSRLAKPKLLEDLPFKEIHAIAKLYLEPKQLLLIAERTNFLQIRKLADESVQDVFSRINYAGDRCDFSQLKESEDPAAELKKMVFINCFGDAIITRELLDYVRRTPNASFEDLRERVRQYDQATAFIKQAASGGPSAAADVNAVASSSGAQDKVKLPCKFCQGTHPPRSCPAFHHRCENCGKKGHFAKCCYSKWRGKAGGKSFEKGPKPAAHVNCIPSAGDDDGSDSDVAFICHSFANDVSPLSIVTEEVSLNGRHVAMLQDTGAGCSILSSVLWETIDCPELQPSNRKLKCYDDHELHVLGSCMLDVVRGNQSMSCKFHVVESARPYGLLGRDILESQSRSIDAVEAAVKPLPYITGVVASMKLKEGARPMFCRARPVPLPLRDAVNKELDRLEAMGVIEPIESGGSENSSPVVWIKKKSGGLRMCADFSVHVNSKILYEDYPLPNIENIFSQMDGARYFAKIDLQSAYWQVQLDQRAQALSVINTNKGLYRVTRLQMGMRNSSAIFQQIIDDVLKNLKGVLTYQDDVLIFATTEESLNKRLNAVMERFRSRRLSINKEKCTQRVSEVSFLGYRISGRGIQPDERLVQKMNSMRSPQNKKELESFLGLTNFFGRLIGNFADKIKPLNLLRKNDAPFVWTEKCNRAFERIKAELSSAPIVQPYSLTKEATLTTDASEHCIAGVLTQEGKPVIYISKSLTAAEQKYSATEREGLGIVWCVERLRQLLLGRKFTLITDHKALIQLFAADKSIPKTASARICRWAIKLMAFDFEIMHRPGEEIPHADALSRLACSSISREDVVASVEIANCTDAAFLQPVVPFSDLKIATDSDPLAQSVKSRVMSGKWTHLSEAERPFARVQDSLTVENDVVYCGSVPFIPPSLRVTVLKKAHSTHQGINATQRFLSKGAWWPGMSREADRFVSQCQRCAALRPATGKAVHEWPKVAPWERLHMDFGHVQDVGNILMIVDAGSGWIEAFRCPDRSTPNIIRIFSSLFARFGVAKHLVSDNAKEFINDEIVTWLTKSGCFKSESPVYFPRANGLAERAVQTVKRAMKAWHRGLRVSFDMFLNKILLVHRTTSIARGASPAEILLGHNLRVPFVSDFTPGDIVLYRPVPSKPASPAEYVISKGINTAWLRAGGRTVLVSRNQFGRANANGGDPTGGPREVVSAAASADCTATDPPDTVPTADTQAAAPSGLVESDAASAQASVRRSMRDSRPPVRYGYDV